MPDYTFADIETGMLDELNGLMAAKLHTLLGSFYGIFNHVQDPIPSNKQEKIEAAINTIGSLDLVCIWTILKTDIKSNIEVIANCRQCFTLWLIKRTPDNLELLARIEQQAATLLPRDLIEFLRGAQVFMYILVDKILAIDVADISSYIWGHYDVKTIVTALEQAELTIKKCIQSACTDVSAQH